jgi:hypothetical protein
MKTISLLFFFAAFLITDVAAQSEHIRDSTTFAGRKAIVFSVSGLIGNIYFSGGLGGKYWISEQYSLKAVLSGSYGSRSYDNSHGSHYENISFNVYLNRGLSSDQQLIPYIGLGAGFNWDEWADDPGRGFSSGDVGYSAILLCGIEYMVLERISLSVEQMVAARYYHDRINAVTQWNVGNAVSTISLAVYF